MNSYAGRVGIGDSLVAGAGDGRQASALANRQVLLDGRHGGLGYDGKVRGISGEGVTQIGTDACRIEIRIEVCCSDEAVSFVLGNKIINRGPRSKKGTKTRERDSGIKKD